MRKLNTKYDQHHFQARLDSLYALKRKYVFLKNDDRLNRIFKVVEHTQSLIG